MRVVSSTVKSDHKAVIAYNGIELRALNKQLRVFRKRSPAQHSLFLDYASQLKIDFASDADVQTNFNNLYAIMTKSSVSILSVSLSVCLSVCHVSVL